MLELLLEQEQTKDRIWFANAVLCAEFYDEHVYALRIMNFKRKTTRLPYSNAFQLCSEQIRS